MGAPRRLLKSLYDPDPEVRWAGVRDLGEWAATEQAARPERVLELLRRLAWSLSEESGATGWGAPEAMGEVLARVPALLDRFGGLFEGWLSHEEAFLGQEALDAGALWAVGRLGPGTPAAFPELSSVLGRFLASPSPVVRGMAAWAARRHGAAGLDTALAALAGDGAEVCLLLDGAVTRTTVSRLAHP
ncbi:MAG: hypothetical protein MUE73_13860 [Planctomycetes bacterium]|jgi:hypothetical protein|nr:hypothetical protein [Planctomycetota bacterium]